MLLYVGVGILKCANSLIDTSLRSIACKRRSSRRRKESRSCCPSRRTSEAWKRYFCAQVLLAGSGCGSHGVGVAYMEWVHYDVLYTFTDC